MSENPRTVGPNDTPGTLHPNPAPERSLVEEMGALVDDIRQIATDIGARPYRVHLVRVCWTGGRVGAGDSQVVEETELLPTPALDTFEGVRSEMRSGGLVERGNARLREVSPRYTEDELRGLFGCANTLPVGEQVFVEVRMDARDGTDVVRRRFVVVGVPYRKADAFEWRVNLLRQDENRTRTGRLPVPGMR